MLLDQRDQRRGVIPADSLGLSRADKITILSDLALWMVRNGLSEVTAQRVRGQMMRSLIKLGEVTGDVGDVFRYLLERSGLLREPTSGQIDFIHRTFQEYLAARAAVENDAIDELVHNATDDRWREVILMAAGLARKGESEELICRLMELEVATTRTQLLAVGCLRTASRLDPAIRKLAEGLVESLLPPRTVEQAELLSGAGELLLDLLADYPPRDEDEAIATIRAAVLVGGDRAIRVLQTLLPDPNSYEAERFSSSKVGRELIGAWLDFEPTAYGEYVLAEWNPRQLTVPDARVLPSVRFLRDTSSISVQGVRSVTDLRPISNLRQLADLQLYCRGELLPDLTPLNGNTQLKGLMVIGAEDQDLSRLPQLGHRYW